MTLMIILAATLTAGQAATAYLALRYLRDRDAADRAERDATRDAHTAASDQFRTALLDSFAQHRAEIADLCQRIQAPEAAIIQHQQDTSTPGGTIDPVTDTEYEDQQQALRDAIWRIEQAENEGVLP